MGSTIPTDIFIRLTRKTKTLENGCIVYDGYIAKDGYALIYDHRTRTKQPVHRIAYEMKYGKITDGLVIDHLCRNRACCNPEHLEAVTQQENCMRGQHPLVVTSRNGICCRGHKMEGENLYKLKSGKFVCKACKNIRRMQDYYKKRNK